MGDRAVVVCYDNAMQFSPGVYVHNHGYQIDELLKKAAPRMRKGDPYYSAARFCGICHEHIPGNLGLGLVPPPANWEEAISEDFFHTNAGTFLLNVDTGDCSCVNGYGFAGGDEQYFRSYQLNP